MLEICGSASYGFMHFFPFSKKKGKCVKSFFSELRLKWKLWLRRRSPKQGANWVGNNRWAKEENTKALSDPGCRKKGKKEGEIMSEMGVSEQKKAVTLTDAYSPSLFSFYHLFSPLLLWMGGGGFFKTKKPPSSLPPFPRRRGRCKNRQLTHTFFSP